MAGDEHLWHGRHAHGVGSALPQITGFGWRLQTGPGNGHVDPGGYMGQTKLRGADDGLVAQPGIIRGGQI